MSDLSVVEKWTEAGILGLLRGRYTRNSGNGPAWVYMEHVRDAAGFAAETTIDALAMHLWPSKHHETHAFEVKVSRSDFRRELANDLRKSASWRAWVEYFWIVAPTDVVPVAELPDGWGLLTCDDAGLRVAKQARRLQPRAARYSEIDKMPRGLVAALLRCAQRIPFVADEGTDQLEETNA